jgi:hypothetical protein
MSFPKGALLAKILDKHPNLYELLHKYPTVLVIASAEFPLLMINGGFG